MASYLFERREKLTVISNSVAIAGGRNCAGDYVPAEPVITITAYFDGEWENDNQLCADMQECINKLQEAFDAHISCRNNNCSNEGYHDGKKNRFGKFFK